MGIEFGSTRIKAVLVDENNMPIASGDHDWENRLENGVWTYTLEDIWTGLQDCYQKMTENVKGKYGVAVEKLAAIGFSAMMHGYLAFDKEGNLLVPFRTWRNTITQEASEALTKVFNFHVPQRWSIAHLYQAILSGEDHVKDIAFFTTLAGYIHWKLSGKTDELIVRQASAPSHYNIALLPDFGRSHLAGPEAQQELNAAVAIASSVAERLIRRGVPFCTVVPTKQGIERFEVCTERDFHELLPRWLSFPVQETGGSGLRYFVMEHLDRYFTRLLIFSAGRYEQDLSGLDSRVGVLVLSAVSGIKTVRVEGSGSCSIMELPTEQDINEVYRVVC